MRAWWWIAGAFLALQIAIVGFAANGPFVDEGLYTVAGMRVLEGHGLIDGYVAWFNGSPFVWPVMAAVGYRAGGLEGARLAAVVLSLVTLLAFAKTAEILFGEAAASWGAAALAANGLFIALAHFAVYDVPALAGVAVAMWCLARSSTAETPRWAMAAGIAAAAAVIAKYGYLPMLVPLSGLLVATHARRDRGRRLALFLLVAGAIIAAYVLVCFGSIVPASTGTYLGQTFRRTRGHIAVLQLTFGIVPFVLASAGAILTWRARRPILVATWLVASAIYPAFHLWTANFVSGQKHAVAGFLFAYLFGGAALDHLWRTGWRARMVGVVTVLTVWGGAQWYWQEHSWSDTRSLTSYLVQHMSRGDRVVADSSWVYVLSLYPRGLIDAPSDVIDAHYSPELDGLDLCRIPWLVGSLDTAPGIRATVDRCGHRPAASAATTQYYLDTVRLRVGQHPSLVTLYRLAAGQEDATRSTESRP